MNVLTFPNNKINFAFAIDGFWKPDKLLVDVPLLAHEMLKRIEKDVACSSDGEFDTEWHVKKEPFEFLCVVQYGYYDSDIEINNIEIYAYWNNADLPVTCNKKALKMLLESHITILKNQTL